MLSAEGDSAVTLEAILPLNEVYFLSVIRTDSTRPRTIGLTKTNADDLEASFAELVGFELLNDTSGAPVNRQCWLEPGKRLRYLPAADAKVSYRRIDVTRERDARKYYTVFQNDGKTMSYEVVQRFEGDSVITTTEIPGLPREARRAVSFGVSGGFRLGRYTGYLCGARVEGPEGEATRALIAPRPCRAVGEEPGSHGSAVPAVRARSRACARNGCSCSGGPREPPPHGAARGRRRRHSRAVTPCRAVPSGRRAVAFPRRWSRWRLAAAASSSTASRRSPAPGSASRSREARDGSSSRSTRPPATRCCLRRARTRWTSMPSCRSTARIT